MAANSYHKGNAAKNKTKKRTTRQSGNQSRSKKASNKKGVNQEVGKYHDEVILIITLVISLLLILSSFHLSGIVGEGINRITFGLFGVFAYIFPYILFFGVAFYIANRGNPVAIRKLISMIGLSIVISGFLQMLSNEDMSKKLKDYFVESGTSKSGGGLIGAGITKICIPLFGIWGTYIVLIACMIILFMFLTEKLFFASLRVQGSKTVSSWKEKRRIYQEQNEGEPVVEKAPEQVVPKRKAKTFTFKKEEETVPIAKESLSEEILEEKEERLPSIPEIQIQQEPDDIKPIYEQELDKKFGTEKNQDIKELANRIIGEYEPENSIPEKNLFIEEPPSREKKEKDLTSNEIVNSASDELNKEIGKSIEQTDEEYLFPPLDLLKKPKTSTKGITEKELTETAVKLQTTLESFGVKVTVTNVSCGPAVTRYELQPEQGVKVSKITGLADDIKLNLAASDIRIEAPIPGKAAVGIEVPNKTNSAVMLRSLIESDEFKEHPSNIAFAVGKDIGGQAMVADIAKMPHLLIAGATGSGKSVCINTIIMSILYRANPADVKLIMVDPKIVELSVYNGIPHLLIPVVTDPKKASAALNWAVAEMTERYNKFAEIGVRDMKGYNEKIKSMEKYQDETYQKMPQIVIIVDELADLMMVAPGDVEDAICRLAQMARAAGIHLIIATQRPSVNVITGLIKANVPSRIAFSVSSSIDSRTILDGSGAEKLLGKGDMLFFPSGYPKPVRVQGAFVSDKEVSSVVEFLAAKNSKPEYSDEIADKITSAISETVQSTTPADDRDEYFVEAGRFVIEKDKASIGMLQRVYKIGFNRAARIMDQLCEAGVVGPEEGTKPRKVIMSEVEFEQFVEECV